MSMDFETWRREIEPTLRRRAYAAIDHDPMSLFERDGGPEGLKAHLYLARLIGPNDEIVDDTMRLASALWEIRLPRPVRLTAVDYDEPAYSSMPVNLYKLQSNYATLSIAPEYGYEGLTYGPQMLATIAFLRYRRVLDFSKPIKAPE